MSRPTSHLMQQIRDEGPPTCLRCSDRGFLAPTTYGGKGERCPECNERTEEQRNREEGQPEIFGEDQ